MSQLEELRSRIISKFGSIGCFCRVSGVDRYDIQKMFACERNAPGKSLERRKEMNDLGVLCSDLSPNNDPIKITPELRSSISAKVDDLGGVVVFSNEHPQFPASSIYQIIDGRRKRMTSHVKELVDFLGVEYG